MAYNTPSEECDGLPPRHLSMISVRRRAMATDKDCPDPSTYELPPPVDMTPEDLAHIVLNAGVPEGLEDEK